MTDRKALRFALAVVAVMLWISAASLAVDVLRFLTDYRLFMLVPALAVIGWAGGGFVVWRARKALAQ